MGLALWGLGAARCAAPATVQGFVDDAVGPHPQLAWPSVEGTVRSSELRCERRPNGEGDWEFNIGFAYRVEGREYEASQQLRWYYVIPYAGAEGDASFLKASCGDIQRLIGAAGLSDARRRAVDAKSPYAPGRGATVYFNPSNAGDAVLKPGLVLGGDWTYGEMVWFSSIFLWLGGGLAFFVGFTKSGAPREIREETPLVDPDGGDEEFESFKREFPDLTIDGVRIAQYEGSAMWTSHLQAGRAFTSRLWTFGVDAKLTNCWTSDYDSHCEITISQQLIASIDLGDWDGIWETELHIPDPRIQESSPEIRLRSVRRKAFPIWGRIRDVVWKGGDFGTDLVDVLNKNQSLKQPILLYRVHSINLDVSRRCWTIAVADWQPPPARLWRCYLFIADQLLRSRLPPL